MTNRFFVPELLNGIDEALLAECDLTVDAIANSFDRIQKVKRRRISMILIAATVALIMMLSIVVFIMFREDKFWDLGALFPFGTSDKTPVENEGFVIKDGVLLKYTGSAREVAVPEGVTTISAEAFEQNSTIRILLLSSTVVNLEDGALSSCENLEEVRVAENGAIKSSGGLIISSDGKRVIYSNEKDVPVHLVIPDGIEEIAACSFFQNQNLKSVVMPSSMNKVGWYAFKECKALEKVLLGGTTKIDADAFAYCSSLVEVDFAEVEYISQKAFYGCTSLKEVVLTKTTEIQSFAFMGAPVEKLELGMYMETLGAEVFNCSKFTEIYIPISMKFIGEKAFENSKIEKVYYRGNQVQWDNVKNNFKGLLSLKDYELIFLDESASMNESINLVFTPGVVKGTCWVSPADPSTAMGKLIVPEKSPSGETVVRIESFKNCILLTEVILPDTVNEISTSVFEGCISLRRVEMPGVTAIGRSAFSGCLLLSEIRLNEGTKYIRDETFKNCISLENINIPSSVIEIGKSVFSGSAVKSLTIPAAAKTLAEGAFVQMEKLELLDLSETKYKSLPRSLANGCTSLKEVRLSDTLEEIGEFAFQSCSSLAEIELPATLKNIGWCAFRDCSSLSQLILPSGLDVIGESAFENTAIRKLTVPKNVRTYANAFVGMTALEEVVFESVPEVLNGFEGSGIVRLVVPDGVKSIGSYAFRGCKNLEEVVIPDSVKSIGSDSFRGCKNLEEVVIPDSVTDIWYNAFGDCTSLKKVTLSGSVEVIEKNVFKGCTALESIIIPDSVVKIEDSAFENCTLLESINLDKVESIGNRCFAYCESLREVKMSDNIVSIGESAFEGCKSLEKVHLSETLKILSYRLLYGCTSLKNFTLPSSLEIIGEESLAKCEIESITLPATVKSISSSAFYGCESLKTVILNDGIEKIGARAFASTAISEIRFPSSLTFLSEYLFENSTTLKTVRFARSEVYISQSFCNNTSVEKVIFEDPTEIKFNYAFAGCTNLKTVDIESGELRVAGSCFSGCTSLSQIDFGKITEINFSAFQGCRSLPSEITIGENVAMIGGSAFEDCTSIKKITFLGEVSVRARSFANCSSLSQIDFNKITSIDNNAFSRCTSLPSEIVLSEKLFNLGSYAFEHCTSIEKFAVGKNFKEFGSGVFLGCTSLKELTIGINTTYPTYSSECDSIKKVYYPGNKEMFDTIVEISSLITNDAEIVYLDTLKAPAGYIMVNETGRFNKRRITYNWIDNIFEFEVTSSEHIDVYGWNTLEEKLPFVFAKNEENSIVFAEGRWMLVSNSELEQK